MIRGITFGTFDLFHAGHVLMLEESKTVCDHLLVCIQRDPSVDREYKNSPVQSLVERQIQDKACVHADELLVYASEKDVLDILHGLRWDVRIIGEEYRHKQFTGRDETLDKLINGSSGSHFFAREKSHLFLLNSFTLL